MRLEEYLALEVASLVKPWNIFNQLKIELFPKPDDRGRRER